MFVQEEKIFAGKVLRVHICAADGSEWLEEATEDTSVEKLKESCLKHVRPSPLRPRCTSASFLPGNQKLRLLSWIPPLSTISTYSPDLRFCLGPTRDLLYSLRLPAVEPLGRVGTAPPAPFWSETQT